MHGRVKTIARTSRPKKFNSVFKKQKSGISKFISSPTENIFFLQGTIGNQAVQRLFKAEMFQPKLTIGQPNDKYEQEADRIADLVMRMPEPPELRQAEEEEQIQTKPLAGQLIPSIQRQGEMEEEKEEEPIQSKLATSDQLQCQEEEAEDEGEETIQTKGTSGYIPKATPELDSRISAIIGGGQLLPKSARDFFGPRFGCDFTNVRVQADAKAAEVSKAVNARAFTMGRHVIFGSGQYAPETMKGKRLLAHELTHVMQQTSPKCVNRVQFEVVDGEQPQRIWERDPFAKWGQRGNRGVSWGNDGPIPHKYRSNVLMALDLVYGLGKNKEFLRKFHYVVTTITKGEASQVQDIWKLITFFFNTLDHMVLHLADTSKDPKIQEFIEKPSPGGPEEGFSYPGRPDVWLMEYRLKQGSRKIANTIVHEAAHVAGVPALLWFDLMIQAIEKASGFQR